MPGAGMMQGGGMGGMPGSGMMMPGGGMPGMPMMQGGGMPMMGGNNFGGMMGPVTRRPRVAMPLVDECPANLRNHCFMNCLPVMQNATQSGNFLPAFACMGVCCHLGPTYVYMFEEFRPRNDNAMGMGNGFGMPGMSMPGMGMPGMDMNMIMMQQMMNGQGGEGANPMVQMMLMQQMMNQQQGEEGQQGAMPNMMQMMLMQL